MQFLTVSHQHFLLLRRMSLVLAVFFISLIFALADSALATGELRFDPPMDKLLHASVYGVIALLLKFSGVIKRSFILWFLVIGIGLLDELHQAMVEGRQSSVADLMADAVGVTLGIMIITMLTKMIIVQPDIKL
jgi:VanZ family protein